MPLFGQVERDFPLIFKCPCFSKYAHVYAKCSQVFFALKQAEVEKKLGCMQITALRCDSQASFCLAAENRGNTEKKKSKKKNYIPDMPVKNV